MMIIAVEATISTGATVMYRLITDKGKKKKIKEEQGGKKELQGQKYVPVAPILIVMFYLFSQNSPC